MNASLTQALILDALQTFGLAVLAIIGATLVVGIAYLVFKKGWSLFYDKSLMIGGFYVRNTPYKGYNRWRSQAWNMKNTM